MMTIKAVAKTGILPEHAIREMSKKGELPAIYVGNRVYVNFGLLVEQLNAISCLKR